MAERSASARKWADIVTIIAGVCALGNAMWGPLIFSAMMHDMPRGDRGIGYNWLAFGLGGLLALLALVIAQRWPGPARIPLVIGGLLLVAVPFAYVRPHPLPVATSVVLGALMLGAAPFLGPLPRRRHEPPAANAPRA